MTFTLGLQASPKMRLDSSFLKNRLGTQLIAGLSLMKQAASYFDISRLIKWLQGTQQERILIIY